MLKWSFINQTKISHIFLVQGPCPFYCSVLLYENIYLCKFWAIAVLLYFNMNIHNLDPPLFKGAGKVNFNYLPWRRDLKN